MYITESIYIVYIKSINIMQMIQQLIKSDKLKE